MENQVTTMPLIGDHAPAFTAISTTGLINFPADYSGMWKILFSHPSDFTPVCTSEFMTFAAMQEKFTDLNCQLIGVSVGGLYSHIAWLREIKNKVEFKGMKDIDVTFPLIADLHMTVANKYGMIQPSASTTHAVRAVFVIDPHDIIRAIIYYPMTLGRNIDELERVVLALQTADAFSVATPANWQLGDDVIRPTADTLAKADEHMNSPHEGTHCSAWFFCTTELSEEDVRNKVYKK